MQTQHCVLALTQAFEMPAPPPQTDDAYPFHLDGGLEMHLRPVGSYRLMLHAPVGKWPQDAEQRTQMASWLLRCNLARAHKSREVLCLDHSLDELALYRILNLRNMEAHAFETATEQFLNSLEFWRGQVARFAQPATPGRTLPLAMMAHSY